MSDIQASKRTLEAVVKAAVEKFHKEQPDHQVLSVQIQSFDTPSGSDYNVSADVQLRPGPTMAGEDKMVANAN